MSKYSIRIGGMFVKVAHDHYGETVVHLSSDIKRADRFDDKEVAITKAKLCKCALGSQVQVDVVSTQVISEVLIEEEWA